MDQKEYRQARFAAPPGACSVILVRHGESRAARPGEPFPWSMAKETLNSHQMVAPRQLELANG